MSRAKGNLAETRACEFLRTHEYAIVARNFYTKYGEIDIIALHENVLHFIEVKSAKEYEAAIQNITPQKMQRILRSCDVYLQAHQLELDYVIDAIIVTPQSIEHLTNITL